MSDAPIAVERNALLRALAALPEVDAVAVPAFGPRACAELAAAADGLEFRRSRPVVGEGERAVRQDLWTAAAPPAASPFHAAATAVEAALDDALAALDAPPVSRPFRFNDMVVQRYDAGSAGISPHRDHARYRGLVAIVVIRAGGRFCVARDRAGRGTRAVAAKAGALVLMRAPGFGGQEDRPFHFVADVDAPRLTLGLRHDARAAAAGAGAAAN